MVVDEAGFHGRQGRLLFAYLVAEQGRAVPKDELAEALWGEELPATWDKSLSVAVSKLRGLLAELGVDGATALTGAFGCYRLELPEGSWVDVLVASEATKDAEDALAAGDLEEAKTAATLAASLVERRFLPGEEGAWVEEKRRELTELRGRALTVLADACLQSGDAKGAVKWGEHAIVLAPYREAAHRRLMEAHVASGNRAEALQAYERCRQFLAEELGAYPSPETEALYRDLLDAPDRLQAVAPQTRLVAVASADPEEASRVIGPRRRTAVLLAATAFTVLVAAGALAARSGGGAEATKAPLNSVVALDESGAIVARVGVGTRPIALATARGALWAANLDDESVTHVDVATRQAVRTISIGDAPAGIAAHNDTVWVTDNLGRLSQVDARYDRRTSTKPLRAAVGFFGGTARPPLVAFGFLWVVSPDGVLLRLDPNTQRVIGSVAVGNHSSAIAAGAGSLWVTNAGDGTVTRIDPSTLMAKEIPVGNGPAALAVNNAGVWIANAGDNAVVRVRPTTNAVTHTTPVGDGPAAILATPTALWVANSRDGTVMRLHPTSGAVTKTIELGGTPTALAVADGKVWVAVAQPPTQSAPERGALLTMRRDFPSLDPAIGPGTGSWIGHTTCASLVAFPDAPVPEGLRIMPEVAERVPTPTEGGTLYTFEIRPGFGFSPPSKETVTAASFRAAIERVTNPRLRSSLSADFSGVVGYQAYVKGKSRGLTGVVAKGRTLTIRLAQPDGAFLSRLANGNACAVPRGTPVARGMNDIPSAGPYYIASYTPRQQLVLERNPNYGGRRPSRLDGIVIAVGVDPVRGLEQVEAGLADYALDLPRNVAPRLTAAYGPGSKAAEAGRQQYFISEALGSRYLHMNTRRPLFSNVRVRRAVSYAIDRAEMVAEGSKSTEVNNFNAGSPTDGYLPPAMPGALRSRIYPVDGPDLRRAKQLAGSLTATAIMYAPNLSPWREEAQIVRRNLAPLGIDVVIKEFPVANYFTRVTRPGEPFDLAVSGYFWSPDAVRVLRFGLGISKFHNAAVSRKLDAAAMLSGRERVRATRAIALELQRDHVPSAAFSTTAARDFFSARIGCQVYHPVWGMDLTTLCLRD